MKDAIFYNETRGVKTDPYFFSRYSNKKTQGRSLGKYQITEGELRAYGKRYLGFVPTADQFLKNSRLQERYMDKKIGFLGSSGYTPQQIADIHFSGITNVSEPGSNKYQSPKYVASFDSVFQASTPQRSSLGLLERSRISEVPSQTLKGLKIIGDVIDTAYGIPGRAITGFNKFVPEKFSEQFGGAVEATTGSKGAGIVAGFAGVLAEPVGGFGKAVRAVSQIKVSEIAPVVSKLVEAIRGAKPLRGQAERLASEERSLRAGKGSAALERTAGERAFFAAKGQLKGELPRPQFEGVRGQLTQREVDSLFDNVKNSNLDFYNKVNAMTGLSKVLGSGGGQIPTPGELKLLGDLFGKPFSNALLSKRTLGQKILQGVIDVANVPRALMASMDMSAPFRQGLVLSIHKPARAVQAFGQMFKFFGKPEYFRGAMEALETRPLFRLGKESGLFLGEASEEAIGLAVKEEGFMSNLAARIPAIGILVKASERAYVGFLNKLRADVFDDVAKVYLDGGINPKTQPQVFKALADFINTASGRGSLGKLNPATPVLNVVFFSPRLIASRVQMLNPYWYFKMPPPVRQEAAKAMVKFVGTGLTILTIAKLGGAQVEDDPRSTDFGKIRMGNIRYDIWGGFQQWTRLTAQLMLGETKSTTSGRITDLTAPNYGDQTRLGRVESFFTGKFAPVPAFVTDLLRGQDAIGNPVTLSNEAWNKVIPLYIQDIQDAVRAEGITGGLSVGVPAFFGVGTQSYSPAKTKTPKKFFPTMPSLPGLPSLPSFSR